MVYPLQDTITGEGRPSMAADRAPSHVLVVQFVAALLQRTLGCPTVEAHQHALQGFLDDLTPWMNPVELPTLLEQPCTLFDHLAFTPELPLQSKALEVSEVAVFTEEYVQTAVFS
jgi:hypothetical protein